MKPATSNLACSLGLPRPITKSHQKKNACGSGLGELPKIWGFPFNISATAEASKLWFCDAPWQTQTASKIWEEKLAEAGELPKNLGFPCNISATAEACDFKIGTPLVFAEVHHKIIPRGKIWAWPWAREAPKNLGFFNISATAVLSS